ncbi:hypothetical protein BD560DRAFT_324928, partial [Blakeslea trispora]
WKLFWRLRVPPSCRSTWFRILHNTVATGLRVHTTIPSLAPLTPLLNLLYSTRRPLPLPFPASF